MTARCATRLDAMPRRNQGQRGNERTPFNKRIDAYRYQELIKIHLGVQYSPKNGALQVIAAQHSGCLSGDELPERPQVQCN